MESIRNYPTGILNLLAFMQKKDILFTDALKLKRPNAFQVMLKPAGSSCNLNCTYCYYLEKSKLYGNSGELQDV